MGNYIDKNGYARRVTDDRLVHRVVAYYQVYLPNKEAYSLPFREYNVHHKDGNKLNNSPENLEPIVRELHFALYHGGPPGEKPDFYSRR